MAGPRLHSTARRTHARITLHAQAESPRNSETKQCPCRRNLSQRCAHCATPNPPICALIADQSRRLFPTNISDPSLHAIPLLPHLHPGCTISWHLLRRIHKLPTTPYHSNQFHSLSTPCLTATLGNTTSEARVTGDNTTARRTRRAAHVYRRANTASSGEERGRHGDW